MVRILFPPAESQERTEREYPAVLLRPGATPRRAGRVVDPDVSDGRAGEDWANCRVPQAVPPKKAANPAVLCTHP